MEGRNFKKIGMGETSLVFESKNKTQENGSVLKFHFHELSDMIDIILQKNNPELYTNSKRLLVVRKMLEEKNKLIVERLSKIEDFNIKQEIINYYNSGNISDLDRIMLLLDDYLLPKGEYIFTKYNKDIEKIRNEYEKISEFFGKDNVLGIKVFKIDKENIGKIDTDETLKLLNRIRKLTKKDLLNSNDFTKIKNYIINNKIEIPIIIQQKFNEFKNDSMVDFCSEVPRDSNFIKILQEDQLTNDYQNTKKELNSCLSKNELYKIVDTDENIKNSMIDFIRNTIKYSKETKKFIDFFGPENVVFYKENDTFKYKLIDPFIGINMNYVNKEINNTSLKDFLEKNKYDIKHFYVYLKTLNNFAEKLGIEERLTPEDIFGTGIQGVEKEINEFIK